MWNVLVEKKRKCVIFKVLLSFFKLRQQVFCAVFEIRIKIKIHQKWYFNQSNSIQFKIYPTHRCLPEYKAHCYYNGSGDVYCCLVSRNFMFERIVSRRWSCYVANNHPRQLCCWTLINQAKKNWPRQKSYQQKKKKNTIVSHRNIIAFVVIVFFPMMTTTFKTNYFTRVPMKWRG